MPPPDPRPAAAEWLTRADRDLQAARTLLRDEPPLPELAVYHAQQAAEKALKGFLAWHSRPFAKVHDLAPLVLECSAVDAGFDQFAATAATLTPYAVQFRYPDEGGPLAPVISDAEEALRLAADLVRFVRSRLGN